MSEILLEKLSDLATDAHTRIQQDFIEINPIIGVSRGMRSIGIPADAMTIDCLKTGKRIIIVLHDHQPDVIQYQFSFKKDDPGDQFEQLKADELTDQIIYDWIKNYFSTE